jgi:exodeoxyribonuclease VII large subunit
MQELSLSELNLKIQQTLEEQLASSYWVVAEITQLQINQSGHCYLELVQKEEGKVIAKARATIWAYSYRNISAWFEKITGTQLNAGMRILANAKVTFHEVYGLSLNVKDIDPSFTLGEREKARQEVIQKLESDGVMEMNRGIELPDVPQKIAIISSETAAGYGDFIDQLINNSYGFNVHYQFFPSTMQGDKAPESIINSLHQIYDANNAELVVIIRGGGSQLDLDCFDDYELCSHIAQFPLPVLTGIGHERDTSIADMVAHTQLKTPTAVAEFIIQGFGVFMANLEDLFNTISSIAGINITSEKEALLYLSSNITQRASLNVHNTKSELVSIIQKLKYLSSKQFIAGTNYINSIEQKIELLNPTNLLNKGYSLSYLNGKPIKKQKISKGDKIETITASQRICSTVDKTLKHINP